MINPEKNLTGGVAKIDEYAGRIKGGEPSEEIMQGLPDSIRMAIESKLNSEGEVEEDPIKTEIQWDSNSEEIVPEQSNTHWMIYF